MRISTRHLRLRGSCRSWPPRAPASSPAPRSPAASRSPAALAQPTRATAKPKPGKKPPAQRVVIKQAPKRATKRPAQKTAKPIGSATLEGSKPTTPQAPVGAPPARWCAPAPTSAAATPAPSRRPCPSRRRRCPRSIRRSRRSPRPTPAAGRHQRGGDPRHRLRRRRAGRARLRARDRRHEPVPDQRLQRRRSRLRPARPARPRDRRDQRRRRLARQGDRLRHRDDRLATKIRHASYPTTSGATAAWAQGLSGQGIGVAVLDSGVTPTADLGSRARPGQAARQAGGSNLNDTVGHGTFVADVLAGQSADGRHVGVAPGAKIYALNVAQDDGVYTSDIVNGLTWVLRQNALLYNIRVVNLSLAESVPSSYQTSALDQAVEAALEAGVVVVTTVRQPRAELELLRPRQRPVRDHGRRVGLERHARRRRRHGRELLVLRRRPPTASSSRRSSPPAATSSRTSRAPRRSTTRRPAANHLEPGFIMANGTSFAAPQVAGAAALLLQRNPPDAEPGQVAPGRHGRPVTGSDAPAVSTSPPRSPTTARSQQREPGHHPVDRVAAAHRDDFGAELRLAAKDAASLQRAATKYEAIRVLEPGRRRVERSR